MSDSDHVAKVELHGELRRRGTLAALGPIRPRWLTRHRLSLKAAQTTAVRPRHGV